MNSLGPVAFNDNVRLLGLESSPDIAISSTTSMGGVTTTLTAPVIGGRHLSLVAYQEGEDIHGYFTLAQITAIKTIIAARLPVILTHQRGTFNVLVLSVSEPKLISTDDVVDPTPGHWYQAEIKMIEV